VLQVSNIETEPLHLELRELNVWEFLSEMRSLHDSPLGEDVQLIWDYPGDLPTVQGDRQKLKYIVENLINNAIKFTECGAVTVSVRYLGLIKALEISIADTGEGISEERMSTIFERFNRGDEADPGVARSGVGLGLYIVKKYLDLLGGKIHVESHVGQGSKFTVQIPAPITQRCSPHEQLLLPTEKENSAALSR